MANICKAAVVASQNGRDVNVRFELMNAKYQTVTEMEFALKETANVDPDSKENCAN